MSKFKWKFVIVPLVIILCVGFISMPFWGTLSKGRCVINNSMQLIAGRIYHSGGLLSSSSTQYVLFYEGTLEKIGGACEYSFYVTKAEYERRMYVQE